MPFIRERPDPRGGLPLPARQGDDPVSDSGSGVGADVRCQVL